MIVSMHQHRIKTQQQKQRVSMNRANFQKVDWNSLLAIIENQDKQIDALLDRMEARFNPFAANRRSRQIQNGQCIIVSITNR